MEFVKVQEVNYWSRVIYIWRCKWIWYISSWVYSDYLSFRGDNELGFISSKVKIGKKEFYIF